MSDNEVMEAAHRFYAEYGKDGGDEIRKRLRDVVRGGDAENITYWQGVLKAFEGLKRR